MRRIQILGTILTLSLVLVSATATIANPEGEVHKGRMGETTWFSLPEHPDMMIFAMDIRKSPFGPYEFMEISIFPDVIVPITDNQDLADWLDTVFGVPGLTIVVEDHELEVRTTDWRQLSAELTVKVESLLIPGLTVEPLSVVFDGERGSNRLAKSGTETMEIPGTGHTMTASMQGFNAFVTVVLYEGTELELTQMTLGMYASWMRFSIAPTP